MRVVLDVDGARDYSAYLLANPYRLVIEVQRTSPPRCRQAKSLRTQPATAANSATQNPDSAWFAASSESSANTTVS